MAMQENPSRMHASIVVPLPTKGSRTTPPGGVTSRTSHLINSSGLTVG
jgi:hypothetical protein